jgi:hypothetical protein
LVLQVDVSIKKSVQSLPLDDLQFIIDITLVAKPRYKEADHADALRPSNQQLWMQNTDLTSAQSPAVDEYCAARWLWKPSLL